MYRRLLLSKQGGIAGITQQLKQDNCAVICIGLGRTGIDCLKTLKAKIYNRIQPDDPDSPISHYSHIKFLAVDSDERAFITDEESDLADYCRLDPDTECFRIAYRGSVQALFEERNFDHHLKHSDNKRFDYSWLPIVKADAGVGGFRQVGRYLFTRKANEFCVRISSLISQATECLDHPKVLIHIFSGVCGGTGGGSFLDACYLVQDAIRRSGVTNCYVCGYFFLPDVNISKIRSHGAISNTIRFLEHNGYASLQELDYCMNFGRNGDKWSQEYEGIGRIETKRQPVDFCHLISSFTAEGNEPENSYNYALNVAANFVLDLYADYSFNSFTSSFSTYSQRISHIHKPYGAEYGYHIIGASAATLPHKEVLTYLTVSFFDHMSSSLKDKSPTKEDCLEFVNKNALSYDKIYSQLISGADLTGFPLNDVSWRDALENDELTVTYFSDMQAKSSEKINENYLLLSRDLAGYFDKQFGQQTQCFPLIMEIYIALKDIACNPDFGPFFAAKLLKSNTRVDLIAIIEGYIKEAQDKLYQERAQEDKLYKEWKMAQDGFFSNKIIFANRSYKTYSNATRNLYIHRARETAMSRMLDLMKTLRDQLVKLSIDFMDILTSTVRQLMDTFHENKRILDDTVVSHRSYEAPIATLDDVMLDLKRTIQAMNMDENIRRFMQEMTSESGIKAWIDGNEDYLVSYINRYFTELFWNYSEKTMTSYLHDKYRMNAPAAITNRIQNELMQDLILKASPMFWATVTYGINHAYKLGYITCPSNCLEAIQAANNYQQMYGGELAARTSDESDRISVIRLFYAVPLCEYQGIFRFEKDSINCKIPVHHIYVNGESFVYGDYTMDRDWSCLPSPVPMRLFDSYDASPRIVEQAQYAKDLYLEAIEKRVIRPVDDRGFGIFSISDTFMDDFRKAFDEGAKKMRDEDRIESVNVLERMKDDIVYDSPNEFLDSGSVEDENNREMVRIEYFVKAPCLQKIVMAEIEKHNEIVDSISILKQK